MRVVGYLHTCLRISCPSLIENTISYTSKSEDSATLDPINILSHQDEIFNHLNNRENTKTVEIYDICDYFKDCK